MNTLEQSLCEPRNERFMEKYIDDLNINIDQLITIRNRLESMVIRTNGDDHREQEVQQSEEEIAINLENLLLERNKTFSELLAQIMHDFERLEEFL